MKNQPLHTVCRLTLLILTVAALTGCFRKVNLEFAVHIPQMRSESCFMMINQALSTVDGVLTTRPDLVNQILYVTYESEKLGEKNIELVVAGLGFQANTLPASPDPQTKLPEECR